MLQTIVSTHVSMAVEDISIADMSRWASVTYPYSFASDAAESKPNAALVR